jgi:hypothetical protein
MVGLHDTFECEAIMRAFWLSSSLAVLALFAAPQVRAEAMQDFTLVNATGYLIDEVDVALPTSKSWGPDILGNRALPHGSNLMVRFQPTTQACKWDIKVKWNDRSEEDCHTPFDLCEISKLTLRHNRSTGVTGADIG